MAQIPLASVAFVKLEGGTHMYSLVAIFSELAAADEF
jgi:hypothetical protein